MPPLWSTYEEIARKVLADMRDALCIDSVEGKQIATGASGVNWEIDAKAWTKGEQGFLLVEARRHTTERLKQEDLAAIAYRVEDIGARGGIVVSPLPLQSGANTLAQAENIAHVKLTADSTADTYLAEFLGKRFLGAAVHESANATDNCDATVVRRTP